MAAYPHRKTVAIFIVCTVVVLGATVYVYGNPFASKTIPAATPLTATIAPTVTDAYVDSADWKKTFFNVNEGDSKNYSTTNAKNIKSSSNETPLTATDLLGREFFSKFMTLRQAGMITNSDATDGLVNQVLENSTLITDEAKSSTLKDLYTFTAEDKNSLQTYANTVARIIKSEQPAENEVMVAKEALESGDMKRLEDIQPIIDAYARVRKELLSTPVPFSVASYHLKLVNGIAQALANAVALRNSTADPLQALNAVSAYPETLNIVFYAVVDLRNYFDQKGVVFGPQEEAYSVFSLK